MRPLVWFRRDLRVADNRALHEAAGAATRGMVGAFIVSPEEWRAHDDAPVKVDFWLRNLRELSAMLAKLNVPLIVLRADQTRQVPGLLLDLAVRAGCDGIYFNHEYEVDERRRDERVIAEFEGEGLQARGFHDRVFFEPGTVRTQQDSFYTVFTPFKKRVVARISEEPVRVLPGLKAQPAIDVRSTSVPESVEGFESPVDPDQWPAGELAAREQLERFVEHGLRAYTKLRDVPAADATSRLSPYLNAGVVSPRQCYAAAAEVGGAGAEKWISELIWREFYQHLLVTHPRVSMGRAFKPWTERVRWRDDPEAFERWCEGRTGVPIVDAAMRQMLEIGWMHNRLRMITAMYLTKDLFIDWRRGERFFMQHLIDGDLGSNNGGWQWSASTGSDAAPYFRVFNPVLQSERYDPEGAFIRAWVPELAGVEGDAIHDPGRLPELARAQLDYPEPLVERAQVRDRVVSAFARAATR